MPLFRSFRDDLTNSAHFAALQANFDPARMRGGGGEDVPNDATGELPCGLIFLEHDEDQAAGLDIRTSSSIHRFHYMRRIRRGVHESQLDGDCRNNRYKPFFRNFTVLKGS